MISLSRQCKDITGMQFGWLTALYPIRKTEDNRNIVWLCRCKCGKTVEYTTGRLMIGRTHSCGTCGYRQQRMFELNAKKIYGMKFGRLTVLYPTDRRSGNSVVWHCKCDCGNECDVSYDQLHKGETVSCGCYQHERVTKWNGEIEHLLADRWHRIQQRCYNPNDKNYPLWGGRGIKMCDEWLQNKRSFIDWGIRAGFKPGLEIDRIDNTKGYSPDNCRWATDEEQANNRTNNRIISVNSVELSCGRWDKYFGLKPGTIWTYQKRHGKDAAIAFIKQKLSSTGKV